MTSAGSPRTIRLPDEVHQLLAGILSFFRKEKEDPGEIWMVGGAIRDLLLGRDAVYDLDLAVSRSPIGPAQRVARGQSAGFVVLDQEREVARVVKSLHGRVVTVDFARYRAPTLDEDLRDRDFTINAIAIKLAWPLLERDLPIYDPLGGVEDLQAKVLRPCSDHLFREDPLRILRAYRFAATLGFTFHPDLETLIVRDVHLLKAVSAERIRDEFFKVLSASDSARWVRSMGQTGVLREILPEFEATRGITQNDWHHLDVFDHTLLALEKFEGLLGQSAFSRSWGKVQAFLAEPISGIRTYLELFKFGCLLHDIGKPACRKVVSPSGGKGKSAEASKPSPHAGSLPESAAIDRPVTEAASEGSGPVAPEDPEGRVVFHGHEMVGARMVEEIGKQWKLSVNEVDFLKKVVKNHMRPGVILQELDQKPEACRNQERDRLLFRFFSETGRDGVGIALMSLADRLSARGAQQEEDLARFAAGIAGFIDSFYQQTENARLPALLTGNDLITQFRLSPGPLFKEILGALKEAQALGEVQTREEAVDFVSRFLAGRKGPPPAAR
ncbi:MAG: tRNA nucleotidyltransferase, CC-adding [Candidatus Ozemobacter sibiricus]|jgi:tRNA nucleotidyltransferase/poly(A) polymerase|uniref:tRNA nucleotidyltransferase, CC-adding n=1 Tax=Candidatus Ozemobacter sibiricus TaxID=2268124 RepID=A0A367ZKC9_9BACT|nr:MAG: tRNA nucleotidyltransferase, CC-adding [Candidatus Ozemobacter sibiricus]